VRQQELEPELLACATTGVSNAKISTAAMVLIIESLHL
jgi:hypothetical protein